MKRRLRVLISAGPTREPIDPVRFLSNYSTGYMGARLAEEALKRGHRVTVVSGPVEEPLPVGASVIPVETGREMERAMRRLSRGADVVIMAAAVADFRPIRRAPIKLPRRARLRLELEAVPDILARLPRRPRQVIVGFALETGHVVARARRKLRMKRLDALFAQRMDGHGAPFGRRRARAWLLTRAEATPLGMLTKERAARLLLDKIEALTSSFTASGAVAKW